jgi:long-subunit fatty acid transport protein
MRTLTTCITFLLLVINFAYSQLAEDAIRIRQNEVGFGANHLAMGGNGVALAKDYSAIYWNPGGLASLKKSEFHAEYSHLNVVNDAVFGGNLMNNNENFSRVRSLGLAVPLPTRRGNFVLAFGYNFVRDFDDYLYFKGINQLSNGLEFELEDEAGNVDWYSFDRDVEQTEEVITEGGLSQVSLGAGISMSPTFDLGVSVNFWKGEEEYRLNFHQLDDTDLYNTYPADFHSYQINNFLQAEYKAVSLKVGGMFKMNRDMRLGIAVEFPTTFTVDERFSTSDELIFDDGYVDAIESDPGEWTYRVRTPYCMDAGIGYQVDRLSLTASATYRDWSQTRFEKPDHFLFDEDYDELLNENNVLRQEYRETLSYQLGAELVFPGDVLFLRGGYAFLPSPLEGAAPEKDRKYYSGGIGFKMGKNVMLDATLIRGNFTRISEDIYTPGGTTEDITENRLFIGVRYNF